MENEAHVTFKQGVKACIPTLLGYAGVGLSLELLQLLQDLACWKLFYCVCLYTLEQHNL